MKVKKARILENYFVALQRENRWAMRKIQNGIYNCKEFCDNQILIIKAIIIIKEDFDLDNSPTLKH